MIIPADTLTQGHLRAHGYRIRSHPARPARTIAGRDQDRYRPHSVLGCKPPAPKAVPMTKRGLLEKAGRVGCVVGETGFEPAASASRRTRGRISPHQGMPPGGPISAVVGNLRVKVRPSASRRASASMLEVDHILGPMARGQGQGESRLGRAATGAKGAGPLEDLARKGGRVRLILARGDPGTRQVEVQRSGITTGSWRLLTKMSRSWPRTRRCVDNARAGSLFSSEM